MADTPQIQWVKSGGLVREDLFVSMSKVSPPLESTSPLNARPFTSQFILGIGFMRLRSSIQVSNGYKNQMTPLDVIVVDALVEV